MANRRRKKPNGTAAEQLNVRVPEELYRRVNSVAGASGKTITDFVTQVLDERTKDHKGDVQRMAQREKVPKKWQQPPLGSQPTPPTRVRARHPAASKC